MRSIKKLIIHCSDSDNPAHDDISVIDKWHKERGFKRVGYHYFIKSNGLRQNGRNIMEIGAHCLGQNSDSIGVCLHGKDFFTSYQFTTLIAIVEICKEAFPDITIHGHYEFSNKTCPNFNVEFLTKLKL